MKTIWQAACAGAIWVCLGCQAETPQEGARREGLLGHHHHLYRLLLGQHAVSGVRLVERLPRLVVRRQQRHLLRR